MHKTYPAGEVDLHGEDADIPWAGEVVCFTRDDGDGGDGHVDVCEWGREEKLTGKEQSGGGIKYFVDLHNLFLWYDIGLGVFHQDEPTLPVLVDNPLRHSFHVLLVPVSDVRPVSTLTLSQVIAAISTPRYRLYLAHFPPAARHSILSCRQPLRSAIRVITLPPMDTFSSANNVPPRCHLPFPPVTASHRVPPQTSTSPPAVTRTIGSLSRQTGYRYPSPTPSSPQQNSISQTSQTGTTARERPPNSDQSGFIPTVAFSRKHRVVTPLAPLKPRPHRQWQLKPQVLTFLG